MTRNCPTQKSSPRIPASLFATQTELVPGLTIHSWNLSGHSAVCLSILDLVDLDAILDDEQTSHLLLNLLSPEEKVILAGYTYSKRRNEWMGGRLAAKTCVGMLDGDHVQPGPLATLSILPTANGSPALSCPSGAGNSLPALSISHSRRYGVAMAAVAPSCGVDIQQISSQTVRVADRFSDPTEQQLLLEALPEMDEPERLTLLWSAKEALKKSLLTDQPVIFKGVRLLAISCDEHLSLRLRYAGKEPVQIDVICVMLGDYILAFTISERHNA